MAEHHRSFAAEGAEPGVPDEPRTPLWLTLLGAGLLTAGILIVAIVASRSGDAPVESGQADAGLPPAAAQASP